MRLRGRICPFKPDKSHCVRGKIKQNRSRTITAKGSPRGGTTGIRIRNENILHRGSYYLAVLTVLLFRAFGCSLRTCSQVAVRHPLNPAGPANEVAQTRKGVRSIVVRARDTDACFINVLKVVC